LRVKKGLCSQSVNWEWFQRVTWNVRINILIFFLKKKKRKKEKAEEADDELEEEEEKEKEEDKCDWRAI
jgi:hypothetical protein